MRADSRGETVAAESRKLPKENQRRARVRP